MPAKRRYCEICSKQIDEERVQELPETRLCVEHGEKIKKYGGEFVAVVSQERTNKPGSLKVNYGGVSVERLGRNTKALEKLRDEYDVEKKQVKQ
jgi:hypothetical protein